MSESERADIDETSVTDDTTKRSSVGYGYGFLGVGEIATAVVTGLSTNTANPPTIFLSPRGRRVGHELATRFPNVHICDSNQDVLEHANQIVLTLPPQIAPTVLTQLTFQPQHIVISAVAGLQLVQLQNWTAPACRAVRAIPLPQAATRHSYTAMYPHDAIADDLFSRVGETFLPDNEQALDAVSAATATFAAHLDYLTTIATWLTNHGVPHQAATTYTARIFGQLGQSLLQHTNALTTMTEKHTTPDGINQQLMNDLRDNGVPNTVQRALDRILARLTQ